MLKIGQQRRLSATSPASVVTARPRRPIPTEARVILPRVPHNTVLRHKVRKQVHTSAIMSSEKKNIETPGMEKEATLLEAFTKIPSIGRVWTAATNDDGLRVTMEVSQRDVPQNSTRKNLVHFMLNEQSLASNGKHVETTMSVMDSVLFMCPSPSGKKTLIVKKSDDKKSPSILQVWNRLSLEFELIVPESLHGPVVNDGWFGERASWSADETKIAYVAEVRFLLM